MAWIENATDRERATSEMKSTEKADEIKVVRHFRNSKLPSLSFTRTPPPPQQNDLTRQRLTILIDSCRGMRQPNHGTYESVIFASSLKAGFPFFLTELEL